MADNVASVHMYPVMPASLDEARAMARQRFKERLENGEQIGECDCSADEATSGSGPRRRLTGVRFLDSGRLYYFDPAEFELAVGDWVVVETSRGKEAGRVVIAPDQVRQATLTGEIKPVQKKLDEHDIEKMERFKRESASAIKVFGQKIRERNMPMKPISAEYNFDGTHLLLNFTAPERVDFRDLARDLAAHFRCRVELRQVGPRDEARLLGGLGRCGRTLCCSSWLPVYPEISMNMAKTQDLPLNPGKVSGVCGRLLCCLSYENEQYKQMKQAMPRLGQQIETPVGTGMVVAMQILKDLVTVRLDVDNTEVTMPAADLGLRRPEGARPSAPPPRPEPVPVPVQPIEAVSEEIADDVDGEEGEDAGQSVAGAQPDAEGGASAGRRRRRRGRGRRGAGGGGDAAPEA